MNILVIINGKVGFLFDCHFTMLCVRFSFQINFKQFDGWIRTISLSKLNESFLICIILIVGNY